MLASGACLQPGKGRKHIPRVWEIAGPCPPGLHNQRTRGENKGAQPQSSFKSPQLCPWYQAARPANFQSPKPAPSHQKQPRPKQVIKEMTDSWRSRDTESPGVTR